MALELTQLGETGGWGKGCLLGLRRSVAVGDSQTAARRPRSMAPTAKSEEKDELTCPFFFFFSQWVSADRLFRNVSAALEPRKPEERGDGFHSTKPFQRDRSAFVGLFSFIK